ncbi:RNA 2',3'-cyclic phosphodiesterase [Patescibacteria group bacterium]|nr:RNA 2',3'-cyclic phosphodiesterase [Patescibacteria group bacterium]
MKKRLFIAIFPPENVLKKIQSFQEDIHSENVKLTQKQNLHATLAFFGSVSSKKQQRIENCISSCAQKIKKHVATVSLNPLFLPSKKHATVIALPINKNNTLSNIYSCITKGLGKEEKKEFLPHVTIGRSKKIITKEAMQRINNDQKETTITFAVEKIVLVESQLQKEGSQYTILRKWKLHEKS